MIQYAKEVLPTVSAWGFLFRKELIKIYNWMPKDQRYEFYTWCYANFQHKYPDVLDEVFGKTILENKPCITKSKNTTRITGKRILIGNAV